MRSCETEAKLSSYLGLSGMFVQMVGLVQIVLTCFEASSYSLSGFPTCTVEELGRDAGRDRFTKCVQMPGLEHVFAKSCAAVSRRQIGPHTSS